MLSLFSARKNISFDRRLQQYPHLYFRLITAEFNKFYLVTAYVTNAGKKLVNLDKRMRWDLMFRLAQDYLLLIKTLIYS